MDLPILNFYSSAVTEELGKMNMRQIEEVGPEILALIRKKTEVRKYPRISFRSLFRFIKPGISLN